MDIWLLCVQYQSYTPVQRLSMVLVQKYLCDGSPARGNMQIEVIGFLMSDIKFSWQSSKKIASVLYLWCKINPFGWVSIMLFNDGLSPCCYSLVVIDSIRAIYPYLFCHSLPPINATPCSNPFINYHHCYDDWIYHLSTTCYEVSNDIHISRSCIYICDYVFHLQARPGIVWALASR